MAYTIPKNQPGRDTGYLYDRAADNVVMGTSYRGYADPTSRFDHMVLAAAKSTTGQSEDKALKRHNKDSSIPDNPRQTIAVVSEHMTLVYLFEGKRKADPGVVTDPSYT